MIIQALAFYLFAGILMLSALCVISVRNPVHSVLFLILAFFNAAGLFLMLGAEFVGMILVIVYVGAVAVLFLFVVMMLEVDFANLRKGAMQYVPLGLSIGALLMAELIIVFKTLNIRAAQKNIAYATAKAGDLTNTEILGSHIYTSYAAPFQMAGIILFIAMIGAIVLTHRQREGVRKQRIGKQHAMTRENAMEIKKVTSGTGAS